MSRLDDELKIAFQRQEPSADFAARVLARLGEAPQARPTVWQRLAGLWAPPVRRWAAAGAMALLLIIIGITIWRTERATGDTDRLHLASAAADFSSLAPGNTRLPFEENQAGTQSWPGTPDNGPAATTAQNNLPSPARTGDGRKLLHHHANAAAHRPEPRPSAEAEAAKEKVLFALQITSETLNDAQRAIVDDHRNEEKPEPVQNR